MGFWKAFRPLKIQDLPDEALIGMTKNDPWMSPTSARFSPFHWKMVMFCWLSLGQQRIVGGLCLVEIVLKFCWIVLQPERLKIVLSQL
jgi:hypothetical protein